MASTAARPADSESFGYAPSGAATFQDALTPSEASAELRLNAEPDGSPPRTTAHRKVGSVSIFGSIRNNRGEDLCAMVLANGAYMFSCSPNGTWSLSTVLDANSQITLFGFADGHFPYRATLGASGGRYDMVLNVAQQVVIPTTDFITFTITDACHDGFGIDYKFYDETNNLVWPTSTTHYFTSLDDTAYASLLQCNSGANICYGARNANPLGGFWGVDVDNSKSCSNCCIHCVNGGSLNVRLTC